MIPLLARIERANLILAVALTTLAGLLWGRPGTLAAGAGALLACADFFVLGRLGARAIAQVRVGGSPWGLGLALIGKMTALFALVFIAIRVVRLAVVPFALGFSVFVVSIVLVSFSAGIGRSEAGA
jgi:ATP synthase I subunit